MRRSEGAGCGWGRLCSGFRCSLIQAHSPHVNDDTLAAVQVLVARDAPLQGQGKEQGGGMSTSVGLHQAGMWQEGPL